MPIEPLGESRPPTILKPRLFLPGPFSNIIVRKEGGNCPVMVAEWFCWPDWNIIAELEFPRFLLFRGSVQKSVEMGLENPIVLAGAGILGKSLLGWISTMDLKVSSSLSWPKIEMNFLTRLKVSIYCARQNCQNWPQLMIRTKWKIGTKWIIGTKWKIRDKMENLGQNGTFR